MTDEQLEYYYKGAYEVGLMFALLIDRYTDELEEYADHFYSRSDLRGDDYLCSANMLKDEVSRMLSGNIDEFIREVRNGDKSRGIAENGC